MLVFNRVVNGSDLFSLSIPLGNDTVLQRRGLCSQLGMLANISALAVAPELLELEAKQRGAQSASSQHQPQPVLWAARGVQ